MNDRVQYNCSFLLTYLSYYGNTCLKCIMFFCIYEQAIRKTKITDDASCNHLVFIPMFASILHLLF